MKISRYFYILPVMLLGLLFSVNLPAQDCKFYFPTEKGTLLEMANYDKKGKVTGYTSQKIIDKKEENGAQIIIFEQSASDKKKENTTTHTMQVKCEDGKFYVGMNNYFESMGLDQYEENPQMEVVVDGDELYFPSELKEGEELPDGTITAKVLSGGMPMITMTVHILNRKVGPKESITTPAGTFECYKISQDVEMKTIMRIRTSETSWIADNIGVVKSEQYDKKGKLMSSSELIKIQKD